MSEQQITQYPGSEVDVQWDKRLCIHVGECGRAQGELFVGGRDPWCVPDNASPAEVRQVCERCPSGALTYRDKLGVDEQAVSENTVTVANRGPLYLRGDLVIAGASENMPGVRYRAALCRCGESKNKPYCDNSHIAADFGDSGSVGEQGSGLTVRGGTLNVQPIANGPLLMEGNLSIRAASGRLAWEGTKTWLCRCGHSKNKPFCDGSHKAAGFKDP